MSKTPIYHATLLDYPELWGGPAKPEYADWFNVEWANLSFKASGPLILSKQGVEFGTPIIPAPESAWKTFLRCLGWWKP